MTKRTAGKRTTEEPKAPEYPKTIETFREVGDYELRGMASERPSVFNNTVSVRRYRVTIELIDEPIEVIHARLIDLWERCDNHHHWDPLRHQAKKYGLDLDGYQRGSRVPRR
jgi:hypothetical protein